MMLPILISVSLAPVSYFFWAKAVPPRAALRAAATVNVIARELNVGISDLPDHLMKPRVFLFFVECCGALD
jgi:hypothetical protein